MDMIVTVAKHKRRCDVMRCTNPTVMEFSRSDSVAGRIDLCQDCIDEIAKYATKVESTDTSVNVTTDKSGYIANDDLNCKYCGRLCGNKMGLAKHEKHCPENPENK